MAGPFDDLTPAERQQVRYAQAGAKIRQANASPWSAEKIGDLLSGVVADHLADDFADGDLVFDAEWMTETYKVEEPAADNFLKLILMRQSDGKRFEVSAVVTVTEVAGG